ncbi:tRNA (adenosine(37)-N6)-dimethylallyltransferase MiaA [Sphingomonadales bacterium 56]|uniref:tRNA (adenosine(37)-N6)-dimethylallyltransferase MiaA n=1 Tax=unclassified Sphingobium TaxID=2611147 RepID=UPI00191A0AB3|nr:MULTISPECIES: tRNA (adenosine(37)-N6)-dimethylallyltransferase MiaA [unclassified Sphingobium]MBY2927776.1 tRNA (adenosine(37)-N6)-dimethylallyltransferase MiaA [Sphingomonadales bacterium 56]MBY2957876.1 tRNA (adenosine(37)-N6)-dimethylallyltransferase MiaA [Sphingomonadales bacterium 58]CAD7335910.1 tRNA dimethylallyltransferase [Sphingobium sp. S6]CAD7335975.1 tRNA dimethylallyltransferase [Sphingobium sp. S8]
MDTPETSKGESRPRVALIAGPTASGKSALAVRLAQSANGIVINADASQVYADLHILSARPSAEDIGGVPHRLFGHIDGAEACTAARWAAEASTEIDKAHAGGRLPILVGGTGLYLRTLLDGIAPVPEIDPDIRSFVRSMAVADAHAALTIEDPVAAARLAPADSTRIARALEVVRSTGKPLGFWQQHKRGGIGERIDLAPLILLPPRDWLIARCDRRFEQMVHMGAVQEVEALLARDLSPDLPVMRAIGVPEIRGWLQGEMDRETMLEKGRIATRQYAKRQYTWFSRQPPPTWAIEQRKIDDKIAKEIVIKLLI